MRLCDICVKHPETAYLTFSGGYPDKHVCDSCYELAIQKYHEWYHKTHPNCHSEKKNAK